MAKKTAGKVSREEASVIRAKAQAGMSIQDIAEGHGRQARTIESVIARGNGAPVAPVEQAKPPEAVPPKPQQANGETLAQVTKAMVLAGETERTYHIPVVIRIG